MSSGIPPSSSSSSNPSHLLISRNPPSPAYPQLFPTSTSRHAQSYHQPRPRPPAHHSPAPAPGPVFPVSSSTSTTEVFYRHARHRSTPALLSSGYEFDGSENNDSLNARAKHSGGGDDGKDGESGLESDGDGSEDEEEDDNVEIVQVHPTFQLDAELKGTVKVIVGKNEFWCHKEVLFFASPFFRGLLQGSWAETARPAQLIRHSSGITTATVTDTTTTEADTDQDTESIAAAATDNHPVHGEHSVLAGQEGVPPSPPTAESATSANGNHSSAQLGLSADTEELVTPANSIYLDAVDYANPPKATRESGQADETEVPVVQVGTPVPAANATSAPSSFPYLTRPPASASHSLPVLLSPSTASVPLPPITTIRSSSLSSAAQRHLSRRPQVTDAHMPKAVRRNRTRSRSRTLRHSFSSLAPVRPGGIGGTPSDRGHGAINDDGQEAEAIVELHEESAAAFQDFLFWAYPHLDCKVTWTNVEALVALSFKLLVNPLQSLCNHFLLTHASGKPVTAMSIAEDYRNPELYREASRFVLDQPTWDEAEMDGLSGETRLKLSQRRNWFLERLLKLGSIDVKKEYQCRADCPDPNRCQALLDEKWRQAHSAVCRYGPPQPSVAFRCLRQLETFPTNPTLVMPHPLCQMAAKSWVMSLFDRMFQFRMIAPLNPGTEKYWLWIAMT